MANFRSWPNSAVEEPLDRVAGDLSLVPAEWSGRNGISVQVRPEYALVVKTTTHLTPLPQMRGIDAMSN